MKLAHVLTNPLWWIGMILFGMSLWCAWPIITLQTYPQFPFMRGYGALALLILAKTIGSSIK